MPKSARRVLLSSGFFYALSALLVVAITAVNIIFAQRPTAAVAAASYSIDSEIAFWEEFTRLHPTYRDAYIQLGELYLEEGNVEQGKQAVKKALEIDPLSENAKTLLREFE